MSRLSARQRARPQPEYGRVDVDPLALSWMIALCFFVLGLVGLDYMAPPLFDERHYGPAANHLLIGDFVANREHPMVAKELIALAIETFGNNAFGWRIAPLLAGTLGLVAWTRAVWWHSHSRTSSLLFAVLLASNFLLFALSRLAMLDVFMFAFAGGAVAAFVLARQRPRWLIACGICLGLAVASKWSAAPLAVAISAGYCWKTRSRPLRGIVCLFALPLLVYAATFAPLLVTRTAPLEIADLPALHLAMLRRLSLLVTESPFASQWWEWLLNNRPIVLARVRDSVFRVVLIAGNPVTMPMIAPVVALAMLFSQRFERARLPAAMYIGLMAFWALSQKPVQYEYHYLLPSTFGLAALAIVADDYRRLAMAGGGLALLAFAWFYPVLIGASLPNRAALARYSWLPGWALHKPVQSLPSLRQREQLRAAQACLEAPRRCN